MIKILCFIGFSLVVVGCASSSIQDKGEPGQASVDSSKTGFGPYIDQEESARSPSADEKRIPAQTFSVGSGEELPACNTLESCSILKKKLEQQIEHMRNIRREQESRPKAVYPVMNLPDAIKYCKKKGEHLPSPRELALYAMKFGAEGIISGCSYSRDCFTINAIDHEGNADSFYYSSKGYSCTSDNGCEASLWSSSVFHDRKSYSYMFEAKTGRLMGYDHSDFLRKYSVEMSTLCFK
jgi:hypothetical protein